MRNEPYMYDVLKRWHHLHMHRLHVCVLHAGSCIRCALLRTGATVARRGCVHPEWYTDIFLFAPPPICIKDIYIFRACSHGVMATEVAPIRDSNDVCNVKQQQRYNQHQRPLTIWLYCRLLNKRRTTTPYFLKLMASAARAPQKVERVQAVLLQERGGRREGVRTFQPRSPARRCDVVILWLFTGLALH